MMRTVEIILVIIILATAFIIGSLFAVLPSPRQSSSLNLRELALTTLQTLDEKHELSYTVFRGPFDPAWGYLETALSAALPPNVIYNFTVYDSPVVYNGTVIFNPVQSFTNARTGLGASSETASVLIPSSNVIFSVTPQKIPKTLYILNCSDANGWWITGYSGQTLAADFRNLLSPYFSTTIMVQSTSQLGSLLNGTKISSSPYESVTNAIIVNTFGEAVPIPSSYVNANSTDNYAAYGYELGKRTGWYNWTWVSIVGYPLYYVSNTAKFASTQNTWGIYGISRVGVGGFNAFLRGINGEAYAYDDQWITLGGSGNPSSAQVQFSTTGRYFSNYYGIYPSANQTATRAVPSWIQSSYGLTATAGVFNPVTASGQTWLAGSTFVHRNQAGQINGQIIPIGLTRIPDVRVTAIALLSYYHPNLYRSEFTSSGTTRLVVLQLGLQGGS